mgnify:CR=1 FL=1
MIAFSHIRTNIIGALIIIGFIVFLSCSPTNIKGDNFEIAKGYFLYSQQLFSYMLVNSCSRVKIDRRRSGVYLNKSMRLAARTAWIKSNPRVNMGRANENIEPEVLKLYTDLRYVINNLTFHLAYMMYM